MKEHRILAHTADLEVQAAASTREELFAAMLEGMAAGTEAEPAPGARQTRRAFELSAPDAAMLLVDFLNEAIGLSGAHHEAYEQVEFDELGETRARGRFIGRPVTRFATEVKAATWHGLELDETGGRHHARVIFDV